MLPQLTVGSEGRVKILGLSYLILDKSYCTLVFKRGMWQNEMTFLHRIEIVFQSPLKRGRPFHSFPRFILLYSHFVLVTKFVKRLISPSSSNYLLLHWQKPFAICFQRVSYWIHVLSSRINCYFHLFQLILLFLKTGLN